MQKICILLLFSVLGYCKAIGQTSLPEIYEIKSDTSWWQPLSHQYWQILEDKTGKFTIDEVLNGSLKNNFHDSISGIDSSASSYWIRYQLKNSKETAAYISLDCQWELADLYLIDSGGKRKHFTSGFNYNWNKKGGWKYSNTIPDTLQPQESRLVYLKLSSRKKGLPGNFEVGFYESRDILQKSYIDYVDSRTNYFDKNTLLEAFIIGLLVLAFFINIFFYRIVKEKAYLYFSLFALFLAVNRLYNMAALYTFWEKPTMQGYVRLLTYAWIFIPYFLIQFFNHFLNLKKIFPKWSKFLVAIGIINGGLFCFIRLLDIFS